MPPTQHGFSFAAKVWGALNVEDMSEVVFNEKAFDQLVLSDEYKDIIKAQVEVFSQKGDQLVTDVVDNKGGGMIMVLHGSPGECLPRLSLSSTNYISYQVPERYSA